MLTFNNDHRETPTPDYQLYFSSRHAPDFGIEFQKIGAVRRLTPETHQVHFYTLPAAIELREGILHLLSEDHMPPYLKEDMLIHTLRLVSDDTPHDTLPRVGITRVVTPDTCRVHWEFIPDFCVQRGKLELVAIDHENKA